MIDDLLNKFEDAWAFKEMIERHTKGKKHDKTDYCSDCNEPGEFVRMALKCPRCHKLLGGM